MADQDTSTDQNDASEPVDNFADEHGVSLSSKVLSGLGIMAVGGFLALWIGPNVAPLLPAGMAPVAAWLSPGGEAGIKAVDVLRLETGQKIDAISTISQSDVEAIIAGQIVLLDESLSARMNAISAPTDTSELEARIDTLERQTQGMRSELAALVTQINDASHAGGITSAETSTEIATYAAALEGLKAEIATLGAQNSALSQRIEGVSVSASQQVEVAETMVTAASDARDATALQSSIDAIDAALATGEPFTNALSAFETAGGGTVPVALADASGGVATMSDLRSAFPEAAHAAIRGAILETSGGGVFSSAGAFLRAQVASRSLTPQEGLAPDAVLSRAEAALKQDDLAEALRELEALPTAAQNVMSDWLDTATTRQTAVEAFKALISNVEAE